MCPKPPEVPFEGKVENNPVQVGYPDQHNCVVDGMVGYIQNIIVITSSFFKLDGR